MSVAKSYAQALFSLTQERAPGVPDAVQVERELEALALAIASSPEMTKLLGGPVVSSEQRGAIVSAVADKIGLSPVVVRAVKIAAEKGRAALFSQIHDEFVRLRVGIEGGLLGEVVSAEPLDVRDQEELAAAFQKKLGKKVVFKSKVDPSLIAGVMVTVGGITYDGSVKSQLQRARNTLAAAVVGQA